MNFILLKNFNNYFNRKIKTLFSISEYTENYDNVIIPDVQFNPNDSVESEVIINFNKDWTPDYLLVVTDTIVSRWFVLNSQRTRAEQYKLKLRRDVISDNYNVVVNAPCYVEKATIRSRDDVAIHNKEGMTLNQIKQSETSIIDKALCPWIVGYYKKDAVTATKHIVVNDIGYPSTGSYASQSAFETSIDYNPLKRYVYKSDIEFDTEWDMKPQGGKYPYTAKIALHDINVYVDEFTDNYYASIYCAITNIPSVGIRESRKSYINNTVIPALNHELDSIKDSIVQSIPNATTTRLPITEGQIVFFEDTGKYYKIHMESSEFYDDITLTEDKPFWTEIERVLTLYGISHEFDAGDNVRTTATYGAEVVTLTYEELPDLDGINLDLKTTNNELLDAPYNMFCIPVGSAIFRRHYVEDDEPTTETITSNISFEQASAIAQKIQHELSSAGGQSNVLDIQILPYLPVYNGISDKIWTHAIPGTRVMRRDPSIDMVDAEEDYDYARIKNGQNNYSIILFPNKSSFSKDTIQDLDSSRSVLTAKIDNEATFYRLCSPNMASIFEFNLVSMNYIDGFHIDCTYKPYSPYIHVCPIWDYNSIYGNNTFEDYRGLICQGDFSLAQLNDTWISYQNNNKNYLNAFNKQISVMEKSNAIAEQQAKWGVASGAIGGAAAGGVTGAVAGGGPVGAGVGAVVGATTSLAAGIADLSNLQKQQGLARENAISQFNYSIGNIKAIPDTISKISAIDKNNRMIPFLEKYSCTDAEKEILANKFTYDGMTIMRIDKIVNFIADEPSFIKGQIIRLDGLNEANQVAYEIYKEIEKGVYM